MPLLSHTTAGAGRSGRLLESQPFGGKEHCEPNPPTTLSRPRGIRGCLATMETSQEPAHQAPITVLSTDPTAACPT
jgi:hypothetical protein